MYFYKVFDLIKIQERPINEILVYLLYILKLFILKKLAIGNFFVILVAYC